MKRFLSFWFILYHSVSLCIILFRILSEIFCYVSKHYTMIQFNIILIRFASCNKMFQTLAFPFQSENICNKPYQKYHKLFHLLSKHHHSVSNWMPFHFVKKWNTLHIFRNKTKIRRKNGSGAVFRKCARPAEKRAAKCDLYVSLTHKIIDSCSCSLYNLYVNMTGR